jgi:hypothetical protein
MDKIRKMSGAAGGHRSRGMARRLSDGTGRKQTQEEGSRMDTLRILYQQCCSGFFHYLIDTLSGSTSSALFKSLSLKISAFAYTHQAATFLSVNYLYL